MDYRNPLLPEWEDETEDGEAPEPDYDLAELEVPC